MTLFTTLSIGQTKVTIADGNEHAPNLWIPTGVPNLMNETFWFTPGKYQVNQFGMD